MSSMLVKRCGWTFAATAAVTLLAACGGGGSGGSDSDNGNGNGDGNGNDVSGGDSLPTRAALTSDADNHDLLFFYSTASGQEGLNAVTPEETGGSPDSDLIDGEAEAVMDASVYRADEFLRYYRGEWDSDEWIVDDFAIDQVLYPRPSDDPLEFAEYFRISTDSAGGLPTPERVSDATGPGIAGGSPRRFQEFNYDDGDDAGLVYPAGSDDWRRVLLSFDENQSPDEFHGDHQVVAPVSDFDLLAPGGYLVLDDDTLVRVDNDLDVIGEPQHDNDPVDGVDVAWMVRYLNDPDGGAYVALLFDDADDWELWVYEGVGDPDQVGTMAPVTDSGGDVLELRNAPLAPGQPETPSDDQVIAMNDALYLGMDIDDVPSLVELAGDEWRVVADSEDAPSGAFGDIAFLIGVDGHIVWAAADGEPIEAVDPETGNVETIDPNTDNGDLETPVPVGRDGWVFYNREDSVVGPDREVAVAARADGSERIELYDARWIGASTDGRMESAPEFAARPSEVFMVRDPGTGDAAIAALEAADPEAGLVELGELPGSANDARMFGVAPGPHRLIQVIDNESNPDLHKVVYVDTREEGSLESVSIEFTEVDTLNYTTANQPLDNF